MLDMHPTVTPSVHIVNPTLTTATAPSPPSMTVPSGVTHSPDNSQKSSPLTPTNSAKQLPAPAPNSASNVPFLWLLQMLQAPLPLLLLALLCRIRVVWGTLLELQWSIISCQTSILHHNFPPHSFQEHMSNLNNLCLISILTYV